MDTACAKFVLFYEENGDTLKTALPERSGRPSLTEGSFLQTPSDLLGKEGCP